jgi:hypothetical protein
MIFLYWYWSRVRIFLVLINYITNQWDQSRGNFVKTLPPGMPPNVLVCVL